MLTLLWLGLASASMSYTLTKTPVFGWVRTRLTKGTLLHHLWECPYCMGHWTALLLVLWLRPAPWTGTWMDWPVAVFAVTTLSMFAVQAIVLTGEVLQLLRAATGWIEDQ